MKGPETSEAKPVGEVSVCLENMTGPLVLKLGKLFQEGGVKLFSNKHEWTVTQTALTKGLCCWVQTKKEPSGRQS